MEKNKKILVTGSNGFIGKNLVVTLKLKGYYVYEYDKTNTLEDLNVYCKDCSFVFHLAGINRPNNANEFMEGNFGFTDNLLKSLKQNKNSAPIIVSSSIQADLDNPYGQSKKAMEDLLKKYAEMNNAQICIYRLPNVFGKWSQPNYNTVIATFCYNIARDIEISISDRNKEVTLVYIDDVIASFISLIELEEWQYTKTIEVSYQKTLGEISDLLYNFKRSRDNKNVPSTKDAFEKKLYSTYLSFLPEDKFSYELKMNIDQRGSFTEFLKTLDRGQVSVNVSRPGITKGNHWHHTKNEKFLVVSGKGVIRFRNILSNKILEYFVSEEKLEVVDIPPGYTHNIENLGDNNMVTIMWANELFDPSAPDTFFLEV